MHNINRVNFATATNIPEYPDFLDIQIKSFKDFFQLETKTAERTDEGLYNTFMENFPISDSRNQFVLEFLDYFVDPSRYTIQECIERGLTYSVPLKARLKLYCTDEEHEDFETIVQDVYLGAIPYMTPSGTFIINGAERVVVSQLHRSPGVFFGQSFHANGTKLYSARVIPFKGSWIEFATDINSVMYAYIDRKKKLPVTTLLRAIGFERDKDILEILELIQKDLKTLEKLNTIQNCIFIRGNHDRYIIERLWEQETPNLEGMDPFDPICIAIVENEKWTAKKIGKKGIDFIRKMPISHREIIGDTLVEFTHAWYQRDDHPPSLSEAINWKKHIQDSYSNISDFVFVLGLSKMSPTLKTQTLLLSKTR